MQPELNVVGHKERHEREGVLLLGRKGLVGGEWG